MDVDRDTFYDDKRVAIIPMGFCYPGKGKSGDLPPRKECAELWHARLLRLLPNIELTLLIGQYAQRHYLPSCDKTLANTVKRWYEYLPAYFPLPHPSPRNQLWLRQHAWFEKTTVPDLQRAIRAILK
jgi:uracil-DNA glycosylase